MASIDNKKYYWLKLDKNFFDKHQIKIIESIPNGKEYVLIYLKLLCEATSHMGELRFSESLAYTDEMLAVITGTNIDILRSAMKVFEGLNLMEIREDGTIFFNQIQQMIGSETGAAIRMREARKQALGTNGNKKEQCSQDIDIEKEKDKEIDIELEQDINQEENKEETETDQTIVEFLKNRRDK